MYTLNFLFIDDTSQSNPNREKIGKLKGVGGLIVPASKVRDLEIEIEEIVVSAGFPEQEIFKWSPGKRDWMKAGLVDEARTRFFSKVLNACKNNDACAICVLNDETCSKANSSSTNHDDDVLALILERFEIFNKQTEASGFVIAAKPGGGTKDENKFLASCIERRSNGSDYSTFSTLAQNVVTMPYSHSRILQASDLVASVSNALVSGHESFALPLLGELKELFIKSSKGQIGGVGLKLHPSLKMGNLYHWLFGDDYFKRGEDYFPMPYSGIAFSKNPEKY